MVALSRTLVLVVIRLVRVSSQSELASAGRAQWAGGAIWVKAGRR